MYDKEIVTEEAILEWYNDIDDEESDWVKTSLSKLIVWLMESSEEESDDD